jgi:hypothetical protein
MQRAPSYVRTGGAKKSKSVYQLSTDFIKRERVIGEKVALSLDLVSAEEAEMQIQNFSFGSIRIDGTTHEHDVVIEGGEIRKRKKKLSKKFRDDFGHTPPSAKENIPGSAAGW